MKKFSKILVAVLALCLLAGVATLAITANSGVDGKYVVDGVGYDSWDEAVAVAGGEKTVYLNEDITLDALPDAKASTYRGNSESGTVPAAEAVTGVEIGYNVVNKNVKLDLNGHSITQSFEGVIFHVINGARLEIVGEGSILGVGTLARVNNSSLVIDAKGAGIIVKTAPDSETHNGNYSVFVVENGAEALFSGYVDITPADEATFIFKAETSKKITFDGARVVVNAPSKAASAATAVTNDFLTFGAGTDVVVNNSHLEIDNGRMFVAAAQNPYDSTSLAGYLDAWLNPIEDAAVPSLKHEADTLCSLTAKNSSIIATSNYLKPSHAYQAQLLQVEDLALVASFDNCYFIGGGESFRASSGATPAQYLASAHQLKFNNCIFEEIPNNCAVRRLFANGTNADWVGGRILAEGKIDVDGTVVNKLTLSVNAYPYMELANGFIGTRFADVAIKNAPVNPTVIDPLSPAPESHALCEYFTAKEIKAGQEIMEGNSMASYTFVGSPTYGSRPGFVTDTRYTGSDGRGAIASTTADYVYETVTEDGNTYTKYAYVTAGSKQQVRLPMGSQSFTSHDYIIQEFDISTATSFINGRADMELATRVFKKDLTFNDDGTLSKDLSAYETYGKSYFLITFENAGRTVQANWKGKTVINIQPGQWTRISTVYEMKYKEIQKEVDTVSGGKAMATFYDFSDSLIHVFVNGTLITTQNFLHAEDAVLHKDLAAKSYFNSRNLYSNDAVLKAGDSVLIDNTFVGSYDGTVSDVSSLINNYPMHTRLDYVCESDAGALVSGESPSASFSTLTSQRNSYLKLEYDAVARSEGTGLRFGDAPDINSTDSDDTDTVLNWHEYDYIVQEFDISTESTLPKRLDLNLGIRHYNKRLTYNSNGTIANEITDANLSEGSSTFRFRIDNYGTLFNANNKARKDIELVPGKWMRVSAVYEMKYTEVQKQVNVVGGGKANADFYDFSESKIHIYIDGELLYSGALFSAADASQNAEVIHLAHFLERSFDVRNADDGSTVLFDNTSVVAYKGTHNPIDLINYFPVNTTEVSASISGTALGRVDGVEYGDEASLLAAVKENSKLELNGNIAGAVPLCDSSVVIKTNGYSFGGFISGTKKLEEYSALGILRGVDADEDERFTAVYDAPAFGIDVELPVVLGSTVPTPEELLPEGEAAYEGSLYKLNAWTKANGTMVVEAGDADADGNIVLIPMFDTERYYYTTQLEGEAVVYYKEADRALLAEKVNALIAENADKALVVVLWDDISLAPVGGDLAAITANTTAPLYFDVNGKNVAVEDDSLAILGASGSEIFVYSSRDGGMFFGDSAIIIGGLYNSEAVEPFRATVGAVENAALGIDADGLNLYVAAGCLVAYQGEPDTEVLTTAEITIDGTLSSHESGAGVPAFILTNCDVKVNVKNIRYASTIPLISVLENAKAEVTVEDSYILALAPNLSELSFVGELGSEASVTVSNTALATGAEVRGEGKIYLGNNVMLYDASAVIGRVGVVVPEGFVAANADFFVEPVDGMQVPVNTVVDSVENLVHITWYDSDAATAIGESYNAAIGALVDADEYYKLVNPVSATQWYDVGFTAWDAPETLQAGELSVYPVCEEPVANVKALKVNLTAYTYFRLNYYLPIENIDVTDYEFSLVGISTDPECSELLPFELVELDGALYVMFNEYPGAADVSVNTRYITFMLGDTVYTDSFEFGVPTYAELIMDNDESSESDKKLIANMVRYANESYKLANNGVGLEAYETILAENAELLLDYAAVKASEQFNEAKDAVNTSKLSKHMTGASFIFGSYQPRFVFLYNSASGVRPPVDMTGDIGEWPDGNRGVFTHIYYENFLGESRDHLAYHVGFTSGGDDAIAAAVANGGWAADDKVYAMTNDVFVCDIIQPIKLAVYAQDGTVVRGTYSLAEYISNLETSGNTEFHDAAMALYAFSLAAQEYGSDLLAE